MAKPVVEVADVRIPVGPHKLPGPLAHTAFRRSLVVSLLYSRGGEKHKQMLCGYGVMIQQFVANLQIQTTAVTTPSYCCTWIRIDISKVLSEHIVCTQEHYCCILALLLRRCETNLDDHYS